MPRVILGDRTEHIVKGIIADRGMSGASIAKTIRKPASTVTYKIRHIENDLAFFRRLVDATAMTDEEIIRVVRELS